MSLLMDALKRAEAAKRQAGAGGAPDATPAAPASPSTPSELTLEPVDKPGNAHPGSTLPNLAQHQAAVDADLAAVPTSAPTRKRHAPPVEKPADKTADGKEAAERNAARNVFAAKQAPKSRLPTGLLLGLASLAAAGIGVYFWWQLQSVASGSLARPAAPPQAMAKAPSQPTPAQELPPPAPAQKPDPVPLPPLAEPTPRPEKPAAPRAAMPTAAPFEAERPIHLSAGRLKQDPTLNRAYDALLADNLTDARRDYEQALRGDPKNTDALLGLAAIATRQGQGDKAAELYLRILEADPKNADARAGLINLKGQSDPALSESRLKTLLASQPDSAALNFALGNLYARQGRWNDAQQAYFGAYTAEPGNADYLFNLAVSLDHLHQKRLAVDYYQMALDAAGSRSVAFDRNQVKTRLLELQP